MQFFKFHDIKVSIVNLKCSIDYSLNYIDKKKCFYVCVTDVNNLVNAYKREPVLKTALNRALLSLPDGRPLSIFGKLIGVKNMDRVAGPDYFKKLLEISNMDKFTHCFVGDTSETLERLVKKVKTKYPNVVIKGVYSPPFRIWDEKDTKDIINAINHYDADIVWISFGGGKQEVWMSENCNQINRGVMVGIGAGFKWFLGDIKRAPTIMQKLSLEWCYRLSQDPIRIKKYITSIPFFLTDFTVLLLLHKLNIKRILPIEENVN